MIMRLDRLIAEIPPPSGLDPDGASVVQELWGGKFGEMSTFMNYTYLSFNFRNRQGARPFVGRARNAQQVLAGGASGEELEVAEELHPEGALAYDLPEQPAVFAPGPEAGEIAQKLREAAGLPKKPTGDVAG